MDTDYLDEDYNNNRRKQRKMSLRVDDVFSHSVDATPQTSRLVNENDGKERRILTANPQVCVAGTSSKDRLEQQARSLVRMPQVNRQTPALKKGNRKTDDGGQTSEQLWAAVEWAWPVERNACSQQSE